MLAVEGVLWVVLEGWVVVVGVVLVLALVACVVVGAAFAGDACVAVLLAGAFFAFRRVGRGVRGGGEVEGCAGDEFCGGCGVDGVGVTGGRGEGEGAVGVRGELPGGEGFQPVVVPAQGQQVVEDGGPALGGVPVVERVQVVEVAAPGGCLAVGPLAAAVGGADFVGDRGGGGVDAGPVCGGGIGGCGLRRGWR